MARSEDASVYEKAFAKSDKTDAVLVVEGKKLHVNKAVLSYHSDYFKALFEEKPTEEITIEKRRLKSFATLISIVHNAPIKRPTYLPEILQLENRFKLPAAKRHLELLFIASSSDRNSLIREADTYKLNEAMSYALSLFQEKEHFNGPYSYSCSPNESFFNSLSIETRMKLFNRALEIEGKIVVPPKPVESPMSICEKVFAKSDKTDAVLVVDGKKLHVNKAILSYHSDYFNALFNSEFKEKSMEEIPIEDVNFVDFATLLSFFHLNPIKPTKENVEKIIVLADRFTFPFIKYYLEPLLTSVGFDEFEMIRIGEKHEMKELIKNAVSRLKFEQFTNVTSNPTFQSFSDKTKSEIFYKFLKL